MGWGKGLTAHRAARASDAWPHPLGRPRSCVRVLAQFLVISSSCDAGTRVCFLCRGTRLILGWGWWLLNRQRLPLGRPRSPGTCVRGLAYRGTSRIRNRHPPWDHRRTPNLLQGARVWRFLMSEVPLQCLVISSATFCVSNSGLRNALKKT